MSKFMFTVVAGLALSMGPVFTKPALAFRHSDHVNPFRSVAQFVLTSEHAADAKFDEGHGQGYLCWKLGPLSARRLAHARPKTASDRDRS